MIINEHKTRATSSKDVRPADEVDRRILSLLHGDARMPNNALADRIATAGFGGKVGGLGQRRTKNETKTRCA